MKTGQEFIEKTKYQNLGKADQEKKMPYPPIEEVYDNDGIINLAKPESDGKYDNNLLDLINERKSIRAYDKSAITQKQLSYFLWCTQGIKEVLKDKATLRTVPSAGARHAFETYLLINSVEGLAKGLYRYFATKYAIVPINLDEKIANTLLKACLGQNMVKKSAVTFFWTAQIYRMTYRYGERGYRYIHLDAGHVCQNLHLAAENKDCGMCAIAAFDDDEVNKALKIDGIENFIVYIAALGKKK